MAAKLFQKILEGLASVAALNGAPLPAPVPVPVEPQPERPASRDFAQLFNEQAPLHW